MINEKYTRTDLAPSLHSSVGRTPLHAAAFTDHVECLQLLLSHNAHVNSVDSSGKTPLMMAAENGQTNTVGKETLEAFIVLSVNIACV